jgi:hypothetical protein
VRKRELHELAPVVGRLGVDHRASQTFLSAPAPLLLDLALRVVSEVPNVVLKCFARVDGTTVGMKLASGVGGVLTVAIKPGTPAMWVELQAFTFHRSDIPRLDQICGQIVAILSQQGTLQLGVAGERGDTLPVHANIWKQAIHEKCSRMVCNRG